MSTTIPSTQDGTHLASGKHLAPGSASDLLVDDDELRRQLENLARDNQQLLAALGLTGQKPEADAAAGPEDVLVENGQLRIRVAELEQQLAGGHSSKEWAEQQKEYEALLEEKSEVIRSLHQKIQELREGGATAPTRSGEPPVPRDELEELRAQTEADREQLRQDETALMQQMTQMEMTMSRERAELARQRNELQRLHSDIRHELEVASRDSTLRDRLASFHRRHQEVSGRKTSAAETAAPAEAPEGASSNDTPLPKKSTGLLRRFFG